MMSPLPEMCSPYVWNSKEADRREVLNTDQELIFKSVFDSLFNVNVKPEQKLTIRTTPGGEVIPPQMQTEMVNSSSYPKEQSSCPSSHRNCFSGNAPNLTPTALVLVVMLSYST